MARLFKSYEGAGAFAEIAEFMTTVGRMLDNLRVYGGTSRVTKDAISLYLDDAAAFSGRAWSPDGRKTTGLDSDSAKPWVKFDKTTYVFSEQAGPPSYPWPDTEVWFEKAYTYGDIVITARM